MARLKSHGTELMRTECERDITDPSESVTWRKTTKAYMSDGTVLKKSDVRFKPDRYHTTGEFYSYGWKVAAKVKKGHTMQEVLDLVRKGISEHPEKGWVIVSGGQAPVVLDQARIMQAAERGDGAGFCKACGAEVDGVEPDARNYRCEECGQHEVYGAEECLL